MKNNILTVVLAASMAMAPITAGGGYALAQAQTAKPSARKLELAKRYFELIDFENQLAPIIEAMGPLMAGSVAAELRIDPQSEEARKLGVLVTETTVEVMADIMPAYLEELSKIAADIFTEEELEGLVAFYSSPVGRSLLEKSPRLEGPATKAMEGLMPQIEKRMGERLCAKLDCDVEPPPRRQGA